MSYLVIKIKSDQRIKPDLFHKTPGFSAKQTAQERPPAAADLTTKALAVMRLNPMVPQLHPTSTQVKTPIHRFIGIFILSFAVLQLEVSLTRVLSVALWYHFGFLVISTALLGFGASGVTLSLWTRLRNTARLERAMTLISLAFALSIVGCFWLLQRIPFAPFSLMTQPMQLLYMPLYLLTIATPFFWAGLGIALLLTQGVMDVNRLYAWDLVGAGLGCVAVIFVMPTFGGAGSIVFSAAVVCLAAVIFGISTGSKWTWISVGLGTILVLGAFAADLWLSISITPNKGGRRRGSTPVYSAWNAFSKIDMFESARSGGRGFAFDGGTAFTGVPDLRPLLDSLKHGAPVTHPVNLREAGMALADKNGQHVLVIGSGAGAEVFEALQYGAAKVTAIEINTIITRIVRTDPFWGGLFSRPEVTLYNDEGRSFIRRSEEQYDAIISVHTISNAALASGALSLSENYVLTREAFDDYLNRLGPDGVLYFTRPEFQIPRLFATTREAFERQGLGDPARHLFAWRHKPSEREGKYAFSAGFLLRKSPFTDEELWQLEGRLASFSDEEDPIELLYTSLRSDSDSVRAVPYATSGDLAIYNEVLRARDLRSFYASQRHELAPATDNKPFFNHRTRWSSLGLDTVRELFSLERGGRLALENQPIAEVTLTVLFIQTVVLATILIIVPLAIFSKRGLRIAGVPGYLLYFAGLGVGFILIEIALIQRFTLYLGRPVYTFASVLANLLIFTGIGAYYSNRFAQQPLRSLRRIIPFLLAVLITMTIVTPFVFSATLSWSIGARVFVAGLLLAPIGFMLGMPFPVALRIVNQQAPTLVPWAWGVNGFFTVIGSIGAVMLGMTLGFIAVIIIAGACYVLSLVVLKTSHAESQ